MEKLDSSIRKGDFVIGFNSSGQVIVKVIPLPEGDPLWFTMSTLQARNLASLLNQKADEAGIYGSQDTTPQESNPGSKG